MKRYYYKKRNHDAKTLIRATALAVSAISSVVLLYIFFPIVSWQIYFAPAFAKSAFVSPIPKTTIVSPSSLKSLLATSVRAFSGVDYTNARNWFPELLLPADGKAPGVPLYRISIPAIHISDAIVSANDYDLSQHLINYPGTPTPSQNGNAVIFGHSTLPQLYNPRDYKTIFAHAYTLKAGDEIFVSLGNVSYTYKIYSITVVDPSETSFFQQQYDTSYLTLVTCTPPGTTWKRLIIKARLVPLS